MRHGNTRNSSLRNEEKETRIIGIAKNGGGMRWFISAIVVSTSTGKGRLTRLKPITLAHPDNAIYFVFFPTDYSILYRFTCSRHMVTLFHQPLLNISTSLASDRKEQTSKTPLVKSIFTPPNQSRKNPNKISINRLLHFLSIDAPT